MPMTTTSSMIEKPRFLISLFPDLQDSGNTFRRFLLGRSILRGAACITSAGCITSHVSGSGSPTQNAVSLSGTQGMRLNRLFQRLPWRAARSDCLLAKMLPVPLRTHP